MNRISEVVGKYVDLQKAEEKYIGACPFHYDKGQSLMVCDRRKIFHCYGCNEHGDAKEFMRLVEYRKGRKAVG